MTDNYDDNYDDNNVGPLPKSQGNGKQPACAAPASGQQERDASGAGSSQPSQLLLDSHGPGSAEMEVASSGFDRITSGLANSNTGSSRDSLASQGASRGPQGFVAGNKRAWDAIFDKFKQEGQDLQGILCWTDPSLLEAIKAKRRRVGNTFCNIFEGLPPLPETIPGLPQPLTPTLPPIDPRQTAGSHSSRQEQLALPSVDPRDTAGEPLIDVERKPGKKSCVGCGSDTHTLRMCLRAGPDGLMKGCTICNSLEHNLAQCRKFKKKMPLSKVTTMVTYRRRMPTFVPIDVWVELIRDAYPGAKKLEGFPWSQTFTMAQPPDVIKDLQNAMDTMGLHSEKPESNFKLPYDPATATWSEVRILAAHPQHGTQKASKEKALEMENRGRAVCLYARRLMDEIRQKTINQLPDDDSVLSKQKRDADSGACHSPKGPRALQAFLELNETLVDISGQELEDRSEEEAETESEDEDGEECEVTEESDGDEDAAPVPLKLSSRGPRRLFQRGARR